MDKLGRVSLAEPPGDWPVWGTESADWVPSADSFAPRSRRLLEGGPYQAAVPPEIAEARYGTDAATAGLVAEASAEIARFDGEAGATTAPLAALLLRTEAASSSQIELLTASSKAIAAAELGRTGRPGADRIVANVQAMRAAVDLAEQ
ncbi:MAG: hypothetical protein LBE08_07135, partial [Bifidobacteriaceae bacterium]|nr:hypothetical protein [Bifidobacteriaceae bacterium]